MFKNSFGHDEVKNHTLPDNLRGRSIHSKIIPTVCNLENMLDKLLKVHGDAAQLKQWKKEVIMHTKSRKSVVKYSVHRRLSGGV